LLDKEIIFEAPEWKGIYSAWKGHIPFAFFLIETLRPKVFVELGVHAGTSYFAFCQAVKKTGCATKCFGVDSWQGDKHAGYYDEKIYKDVFNYNRKHYGQFSFLLKQYFDDALTAFEDRSIDLLHIDGFHTYEAVSHDFESWLPKMSKRGVVLFHDTVVTDEDFGVWKLWEAIKNKYPSFNFTHSYGLGVLAVGGRADENFLGVIEKLGNSPFHRKLFESLGKGVLADDLLGTKDAQLAAAQSELAGKVAEYDKQITGLNLGWNERDERIAGLSQAVMDSEKQNADLNGKITGLHQAAAERDKQIAALDQAVLERDEQIAGLSQAVMDSEKQNADLNGKITGLHPAAAERDKQIAALRREMDKIYGSKKWKTITWFDNRVSKWAKLLRLRRPRNDAYCIKRSGLFDGKWYLDAYPDVAEAKMDPLEHYLTYGASEGRNPNPKFDGRWYLQQYPDVADVGMNSLAHYIRCGRKKGFKTSETLVPAAAIKDKPRAVLRSARSYPSGISIIIPTYNAGPLFKRVLEAITHQEFPGARELIVIDSGSQDGTDELAESYGARVERISNREFHHSRTRQWALSFANYDRVVYMVQDATPTDKSWLKTLQNVLDGDVAAAYGRQLPYEDADLYARFETENHSEYLGDVPRIQGISSNPQRTSYQRALYESRFDNVCAIYWHQALDNTFFPEVPYGEDMAWARAVIEKGMKIRYSPEMRIRHSHTRPPGYRLKRTIVDTVACARILDRLEQDLRPAGAAEINALEEFSARLLDEKTQAVDSNANWRDVFLKSHLAEKILAEKLWPMGNRSRQIASLMNRQTHSVLRMIAERYPEATKTEFLSCIPQAVACSQGLIIGRIYASYLLHGAVPPDLDERIRPLMTGV